MRKRVSADSADGTGTPRGIPPMKTVRNRPNRIRAITLYKSVEYFPVLKRVHVEKSPAVAVLLQPGRAAENSVSRRLRVATSLNLHLLTTDQA